MDVHVSQAQTEIPPLSDDSAVRGCPLVPQPRDAAGVLGERRRAGHSTRVSGGQSQHIHLYLVIIII